MLYVTSVVLLRKVLELYSQWELFFTSFFIQPTYMNGVRTKKSPNLVRTTTTITHQRNRFERVYTVASNALQVGSNVSIRFCLWARRCCSHNRNDRFECSTLVERIPICRTPLSIYLCHSYRKQPNECSYWYTYVLHCIVIYFQMYAIELTSLNSWWCIKKTKREVGGSNWLDVSLLWNLDLNLIVEPSFYLEFVSRKKSRQSGLWSIIASVW